ncbi:hypothetical protein DN826_17180 [Stutzerimonas nosocomialis]|uniref:hypothetical protein n=1 Tax=Stutzerimonas nosocomialis TaxID=1056496 RepID=UPI0011088027|nr:hypothetical protein [Stutzerimonas nosocomialis]TLX53649.1 hypothetical protein DN826_17180 [Stutzerimonas nosocomialis]
MIADYLYNMAMFYGLIFTSAGFVLGLFYNSRKVYRLEDKVQRLKRTVRHLSHKLDQDREPELFETPQHASHSEAPRQKPAHGQSMEGKFMAMDMQVAK